MAERETLLLIDGHALVFRAFFAMPALTNSRGEMTNAAFGFTSMLLKVFSEHSPTYAIACFDPPGPTFRHQEFAEYKAQRPPVPDELRRQLPICKELVAALSIPISELPGFEADDVIGTLARQAEERGLEVLILTGDIDALQLVTEHISVYASRRGITDTIVYDRERTWERYGFPAPLVADFKALQGDVSDNIPGVPGIGEKTAKTLIQEYGPLEAILDAVPAMKEGRVKRTLAEHADQARLSKRMATIVTDLDVPLELEGARLEDYDVDRVKAIFDELEFRSLLGRLPRYRGQERAAGTGGGPAQARLPLAPASDDVSVTVVGDAAASVAAAAALRRCPTGIALRTVVEEPARRGHLVGLALAAMDDPTTAWYVPIAHQEAAGDEAVLAPLLELLADPQVRVTVYDLKRELLAWRHRGVRVAGCDCDLLLCAYLVNTRTRVPPLPILAEELCAVRMAGEEELLGSGRNARRPAQLGVEEAAQYYGRWTAMMGPLRAELLPQLDEFSMHALHDDMELPLSGVLAEMEVNGIRVDLDALAVLSRELYDRIAALETEVHDIAGHPFNIGSTQQLAAVLYDDLGLAAGRRTKTGRSTDADSLDSLREEHPIVDLILEWRQLTKLKGTYVDALPLLVERDGRVHTSFHQTGAATGRLSSSDPNLQNVPIRSEWGLRVRSTFVGDAPDHRLVSADYSQIELRVLAHVTGEQDLVDAFRRGEDIHARTAAEVAGVGPEAVTPTMRRNAKVVNFGVLYGLSDFGLARDTGMTREEAAAFIAAYFANFAAVARYLEQIRNFVRTWGYVETLFGRRRYIPDVHAANRAIRNAAERMATNMPIQGTAADIMKLAMTRTQAALDERGMRSRLLLTVHDELVLEAPRAEVDDLVPLLCQTMGGAADLVVPLDVDVKVGRNWRDMEMVGRPSAAAAGS